MVYCKLTHNLSKHGILGDFNPESKPYVLMVTFIKMKWIILLVTFLRMVNVITMSVKL